MGSQFGINTNVPSSTVTATTLAGFVLSAVWAIVNKFYLPRVGIDLDAEMVAIENSFSVAVSAAVGYFKKENVYEFKLKEQGE